MKCRTTRQYTLLQVVNPQARCSRSSIPRVLQRHCRACALQEAAPSGMQQASSQAPGQQKTVGVVIVDHGSKRSEANDMLGEFAELFKRNHEQHEIVELAHMELAEPSIKQAVQSCAARGATHVVIAPYFLSNGRHVQSDIPRLAEEAGANLPGVHIQVAQPIGIDPMMAQVIDSRVQDALEMFD